MYVLYWETANGTKVYLKSHNMQTNEFTTTRNVDVAEEFTQANAATVKSWLATEFGYAETDIHSGQKPH